MALPLPTGWSAGNVNAEPKLAFLGGLAQVDSTTASNSSVNLIILVKDCA